MVSHLAAQNFKKAVNMDVKKQIQILLAIRSNRIDLIQADFHSKVRFFVCKCMCANFFFLRRGVFFDE